MPTIRTDSDLENFFENLDKPDENAFKDLIASKQNIIRDLYYNWINNENGAGAIGDLHRLYLQGDSVFPKRSDIDTNDPVHIRRLAVSQQTTADTDDEFGMSKFKVGLFNSEGNSPTVSANTKISIELFFSNGERICGLNYDYDADKDIKADAPDATNIAASYSPSASTKILDRDGNSISGIGVAEIQATLVSGSISTVNHELSLEWNKRLFSINHNMHSTPSDLDGPGKWTYYWVISVEEDSKMISQSILVTPIKHQGEPTYKFCLHQDDNTSGVVVGVSGDEVFLMHGFSDSKISQNVSGRYGANNPSKLIPNGPGITYSDSPRWSNVCFDHQAPAVGGLWIEPLKPFVVSAPEAWWGNNPGNDRVYIITPTNNSADSFAGNLNWLQVIPQPFPSQTANTSFVTACFDQKSQTLGRSDIFMQDQTNEMYVMRWNGTSYQKVSTAPWPIVGTRLVRIEFFDTNRAVIISSSGLTGAVSLEYMEYNAGDRFEAASWTVSPITLGTVDGSRGIWFDGESNTRPVVMTLRNSNGIAQRYTWDGANWINTTGSLINGTNDQNPKGHEVQSLVSIKGQGIGVGPQDTRPLIVSSGRKSFNGNSYLRNFWGIDGSFLYPSDPQSYITKNSKTSITGSTMYY